MYSTWAYQCTKYERNQILSYVRPIFFSYRHLLCWGKLFLLFLVNRVGGQGHRGKG